MLDSEVVSFKNQFLIAMPHLKDPDFSQSVTYICEHNKEGAMGIVINLPSHLSYNDIFDDLGITISNSKVKDLPALNGGPVQVNRGFIIHKTKGDWESSMETGNDIYLTVSRDVMENIAQGSGPSDFIIALGYAGWDAGQLEMEFSQNAWLNAPVDEDILFKLPYEERWHATARAIGVDLNLLSTQYGHS